MTVNEDLRRNVMTKTLMLFTIFACVLAAPATADNIAPAKRADIEELMRITGALDMTKQMSNFLVLQKSQAIKAARPDLPAKVYQILGEEINRVIEEQMTAQGGFLDMVIPIYARYFSHEDIKGLLKFYQTELGQKTIKTLPLILQESMTLEQDWSGALGPLIKNRVNQRFKKEGIDFSI